MVIFFDMAKREIVKYPDPFLRKVSEEVVEIDDEVRALIRDMFDTMEKDDGIGLAAPQVGVSRRIIVVSIDKKGFEKLALINPVIESLSDEQAVMEEGCLSIPDIHADVERSARVVVRAQARSGRLIEIRATDLLARVLQHEIDHLNGVLFIDRIDDQSRKRIEKDLYELEDRYADAFR